MWATLCGAEGRLHLGLPAQPLRHPGHPLLSIPLPPWSSGHPHTCQPCKLPRCTPGGSLGPLGGSALPGKCGPILPVRLPYLQICLLRNVIRNPQTNTPGALVVIAVVQRRVRNLVPRACSVAQQGRHSAFLFQLILGANVLSAVSRGPCFSRFCAVWW